MGMLKSDPKPKLNCGEGKTKQSQKDQCDINKIMSKYNRTGKLPDMIKKNAAYGDFSKPLDYQESLNTVIKAQESFAALPSAVRKKFNNDPQEMLAYVDDPKNIDSLVDMGLAVKKEESNPGPKVKIPPKKEDTPDDKK